MDQKKRLFIYDRKEVGVLILLGVTVALFAFTLGIHLGKKVTPKDVTHVTTQISPVPMVSDQVPERFEMNEQAKDAPQAADESLSRSLHDEVEKTGIRMETPRAVDLPENTKSKSGGATSRESHPAPLHGEAPTVTHSENKPLPHKGSASVTHFSALSRPSSGGKYTLQVGAFKSPEDAKPEVDALESKGVQPFVRLVDLNQKGRWYRLYIGGYDTVSEADKAGARYKVKNVISTFIVAKTPD
ncbi:MAG: SPOR domain-containing protein [Methylotenera sp.]|nr:SPOR domain-containing protein [Oligoflexia bacterium]